MALSTVGPYRILERLGAGANGEVFLAEDTRLQRRVALKTLTGSGGSDAAEQRRRLLREARAAARLNHPHIAAVYDVLESDEGVHIVMEYVRGTTLSAQLRQGPPPPMQALAIALQLSDALAHAHALGVVHRDLKPANVALAPDGTAKILDFGLARLSAVDLGSTPLPSSELSVDARHTVGTPPYIPPEHLSGAPVDERGDIYSLGVTLFETLTGRRPFEPTGGKGLADAILTAPTPRTRSFCPGCPEGLDAIVFKAMARNPAERYASASELLADLRRVRTDITDAPTQSRPMAETVVAPPRFGGRRTIAKAAAAALAVALAIYGALGAGRAGQLGGASVATANVVAVLPLEGASADPETESLAAGVADSVIASLSRIDGLTVVARSATLKYRDRKMDPSKIARELGATLYVDALLQRSGDRLRISVSVLEPGSTKARWQSTYDGTYAEVFDLQAEVATAVADAVRLPKPRGPEVAIRPTDDLDAFAEYAQARAFYERPDVKENLDRSIALYQSAARRDPRFARAHAGLGEAYWRKYQVTRDEQWAVAARDAINEALRLEPRDASVRLGLATIYRGLGRNEQAAEELRTVIASSPQLDEPHRQLGLALVALGKTEEGLAAMREAIRLRPNYFVHHQTLGTTYYNLGRFVEAAKCFERMVQLQPDSGVGYNLLGSARHAMDDTDGAAALYQKAIDLGSANAYSNLGLLQKGLGLYREAARNLEQAVRTDPNSAALQLNLADAYALLGRPNEARIAYARALELGRAHVRAMPADARALARLAVIESKSGRAEDAARHADEAVAHDPTNMDTHFYRAVVLVRARRLDDAIRSLEDALRCGYSPKRARIDPDLEPLRGRRDYESLLSDIKWSAK